MDLNQSKRNTTLWLNGSKSLKIKWKYSKENLKYAMNLKNRKDGKLNPIFSLIRCPSKYFALYICHAVKIILKNQKIFHSECLAKLKISGFKEAANFINKLKPVSYIVAGVFWINIKTDKIINISRAKRKWQRKWEPSF